MRVVTWNLWHGLSPTEKWWFEELEPQGRREVRQELQEQVLKDLGADIYILQEVNPVRHRSRKLAKALAVHEIHQADAKGLKLFNLGFPLNLNSGLSILHTDKLKCMNVHVTNLSGTTPLLNDWGSLQWEENRVLLAVMFEADDGKIITVANTHFHHGLEQTEDLQKSLTNLSEELRGELLERYSSGDVRRKEELEIALLEINRLKAKSDLFIFAGDFNFSPKTANYETLVQSGYVDLWQQLRGDEDGFTFDSKKNSSNHHFQERFRLPIEINDLTFSVEIKEFLNKTLRDADRRPRRIDYMWVNESAVSAFNKIDLFGFENSAGVAPSDHFGLVADFDLTRLS